MFMLNNPSEVIENDDLYNIPPQQKVEEFSVFLLGEYNNIAQAHFKATDTISEFFKHYLTIVTIPIPIVLVLLNLDFVRNALTIPSPTSYLFLDITIAILYVVAGVGLMVFLYILNLRWDALLYARTVNSIRKYFFDNNDQLTIEIKDAIRVLPQSPFLPRYCEYSYFGSVIIAFAALNSLYFFLAGVIFLFSNYVELNILNPFNIALTGLFFGIHFIFYNRKSEHRENRYLQSSKIGVDIDGVLNQHREHFCHILNSVTGKAISPEDITSIPVRNCPKLDVSEEDEINVFNQPEYWTEMPVSHNAASTLSKIRHSLQMDVHIFSSRPWPIIKYEDDHGKRQITQGWKQRADNYDDAYVSNLNLMRKQMIKFRRFKQMFPFSKRILLRILFGIRPIEKITYTWLLSNKFEFDRLIIEEGNEHVSLSSAKVHNRFTYAKLLPLRFFVEDDLAKATKLAFICDFVFLIKHPYNIAENVPGNVIRVDDWEGIYAHLKRLC